VTESYALADRPSVRAYAALFGRARRRTNVRDMRRTLEWIRAFVEPGAVEPRAG
jgi:hypothetical protein